MEQKTSYEKAHTQAEYIFRALLPENGLVVREAQITMCHEMLDTLFWGRIAMCDAGVGIGKTYAYLVACLLWQSYRPKHLPGTVTISTSSIALQNAILTEYLPFLSRVFLEAGLLKQPVRAMVRKGKERFVCEIRLAERRAQILHRNSRRESTALRQLEKTCDLDETLGISGFDRRHVCVPPFCPKNCIAKELCRYRQYLKEACGADVTVQICNHNYLLADAEHRRQAMKPLLKDYRVLVIDEAHKLPEAARQMYSRSVSQGNLRDACRLLQREHFVRAAGRLAEAQAVLCASLSGENRLWEETRCVFILTPSRARALEGVIHCLREITAQVERYLPRWVAVYLDDMADTLAIFQREDPRRVLYIQYDHTGEPVLCAASRETPSQLEQALWSRGTPVILTSGTLASGKSFVRARQMLGLEQIRRVKESMALSPFDYQQNCLLYIPEDMPPSRDQNEAEALAQRIEKLVTAAHGHALVLFTSYRLMGAVYARLRGRLAFPLLEAWRNGQQVVRQFKNMPNAVLFAAGPCWEGMDFPGDMVSLLVIARLPFPVPDPVSEAEEKQYPSLRDYIQAVVVPDMQRKLRQGFGRAIRTETDTCVVAILDRRAARGQRYHRAVLEALPECRITDSMERVAQFIQKHKTPEYFC